VGIILGALGERFLSAQQPSIKRTELLETAIEGMERKEAILYVAELAPGASAGKHTHPGPEFAYVLDGTLTIEPQGQEPKTYKAGEVFHNAAKIIHDATSTSTTAPSKVPVFLLAEQDQPLATQRRSHPASSHRGGIPGGYSPYPLPAEYPMLSKHFLAHHQRDTEGWTAVLCM
jgi:quercetin dioxygenase-like cupin family protein